MSIVSTVVECAGYMVSRMLGAVPVLADSIVEQLCKASDKASDSHQHLGAQTEDDAAALSAAVWHSIWPVERCGCLRSRITLPSIALATVTLLFPQKTIWADCNIVMAR